NYGSSIGHYDSNAIEMVTILAMLLGSINFGLHFMAWRNTDPRIYVRDSEARTFLAMVVVVTVFVTLTLLLSGTYTLIPDAFLSAMCMVVSVGTTTGLSVDGYGAWPTFTPLLLLMGGFVGGCAGSTTRGMKVMRFQLLSKQGMREISQLAHPPATIRVKMGGKVVPARIIQAVWGFFAVYVTVFTVMFLALLADGVGEFTAFAAVAACINNLGIGLADVASSFASLPGPSKWLLCVTMIMGRLEIFTLLVIFTPAFWR